MKKIRKTTLRLFRGDDSGRPLLRQIYLFLLFCLGLTGCATLEAPPPASPATALRSDWVQVLPPATQRPTEWSLSGKIAIQKGEKGDSANFDWHVSDDDFVLTLSGPWAGQGITLKSTLEGVILTDQRGKVYRDKTVEALSDKALGWSIPWLELKYWIMGIPSPTTPPHPKPEFQKSPSGKYPILVQKGWKINYLSFFEGTPRPRKIFADRVAPTADESLKIKIWINDWDPHWR